MDVPNIIKKAVGAKCTYASFLTNVKGELKLQLHVLTEDGKKNELRFNVGKPVAELTEQDLKDLLHVVFKQIFTKSWDKQADELFQK